jgi:hypothetical protein
VIHAIDAAFQDREIAFGGVGVRVAANVFLGGMNNRAMGFEFLAY